MSRIIITGGTGAIGNALIRQALERGDEVCCIVHKGSRRVSNLPSHPRLAILGCDLSEYGELMLEGRFDVLIHLAWEKTFGASRDDAEVQTHNIQYTLDAVRLAERCGCKAFIGAGSQAEYGIQTVPLTPDLPVRPESGYGIAKYAAGKLSAMLCKQLGIRHNWIRVLSIYGPYDGENSLISYLIRELKAGNSPQLTRCEQIWDYLYADDAANAFLAVADRGVDGKVYPLGCGSGRPLSAYVEELRDTVNPGVPVNFGAREYYPHQPMYLVADIRTLTEDTGWQPVIPFSEGIRMITTE